MDQRIINDIISGKGEIIDTVEQGGGYSTDAPMQANIDSDGDGMANWFEDLYGFDSKVADGNGDKDGDGYTNLEEYINGLITGFNTEQTLSLRGVALFRRISC